MKLAYTAVVFDCDGVIFDSNALKTQAFREILRAYPPAIVEEFVSYHQRKGGVSRYVKLRAFFTDFLQIPVDEAALENLLLEFGRACQRLYQTAALTPGCLATLETLSQQAALYVASGSDEAELRQIFVDRHLARFFQKVYGSPKTKKDCVAEIVREVGADARILLVGDAESDWRAAREFDADFIFMARFSEARAMMSEKAKTEKFPVIDTLEDLPLLLNCLPVK